MSATEREHVMPPRPLMPWTIALCAGLCASCGLVLNMAADALLGERAAPVTLLMAIPVAAAGCIVLARSCMRLVRWRRWLYAAALGLVAGAVVSAGWAIGALRASRALDNRAASSLEFVVCGDPSINDGAYSYTCDAYAGEKRLGQVRLSCDRELGAGSNVRAIGRISRFENDAYGRSRVLRGELRKVKVVRLVSIDEGPPGPLSWLRNELLAVIAPATDPARSLIAGVVCGRSSELRAQPAGDWFSVTGTAHLVAVSGSHLAIVGFVIESALQKTRLSRGLQRGLLVLALAAYAVFTGFAFGRARVLHGGGDACRERRRTSSSWPLGPIFDHGGLCAAAADGIVRNGFSAFVRQCFCHPLFLPLRHLRLGRAGHAIGCRQRFVCHAVLAAGDTSRYDSRI